MYSTSCKIAQLDELWFQENVLVEICELWFSKAGVALFSDFMPNVFAINTQGVHQRNPEFHSLKFVLGIV